MHGPDDADLLILIRAISGRSAHSGRRHSVVCADGGHSLLSTLENPAREYFLSDVEKKRRLARNSGARRG